MPSEIVWTLEDLSDDGRVTWGGESWQARVDAEVVEGCQK